MNEDLAQPMTNRHPAERVVELEDVTDEQKRIVAADSIPQGGNGRRYLAHRVVVLFCIICVLAVAISACAPIPCQSGYADPNWCRDQFVGGGG